MQKAYNVGELLCTLKDAHSFAIVKAEGPEVEISIGLSDCYVLRLKFAASEKYSSKSDKQVEKLKSLADIARDAAELSRAAISG